MNKNIGFRRNIYRVWMDAAAALCIQTDNLSELRARLDPIVAVQVPSRENRRMALDILINIWGKSAASHPVLRTDALKLYAGTENAADRLWLHYGMTLLTYPFFRLGAITIGQISRHAEIITPKEVKARMIAELGQLGALEKATERIIFTLRNWGILVETGQRYAYQPMRRALTATSPALEEWMLAVALTAHPAEELPFDDLVRLPELFPFRFTIGVDQIRKSARFEVHRQGAGWDMVRQMEQRV